MSQNPHIRQSQRMRGLVLFVALVVCSVVAGLAQRACWIAYLRRSDYGLHDVVVPVSAWITHHTSAVGLALDVLIFGPWVILAGWLWLGRARAKRMPNKPAPPNAGSASQLTIGTSLARRR